MTVSILRRYLKTRYVRSARGPVEYDCWGLVRDARAELFGRSVLPVLTDAQPGAMRAITRAVDSVSGLHGFTPKCDAMPGDIATAWMGGLCVHVGLVVSVDGQPRILETDAPTGPCLTALHRFAARYTKVLYYDDQDLPRPDAERAGGDSPVGWDPRRLV